MMVCAHVMCQKNRSIWPLPMPMARELIEIPRQGRPADIQAIGPFMGLQTAYLTRARPTNLRSFLLAAIFYIRACTCHIRKEEEKNKTQERRVLRDRPTSDCMGVEFSSPREGFNVLAREKRERRTWESARFIQWCCTLSRFSFRFL